MVVWSDCKPAGDGSLAADVAKCEEDHAIWYLRSPHFWRRGNSILSECEMLSKCANPECSEVLRYLHEGTIFYLAPTPEVAIATGMHPELHERFWLCAECSKKMTLTWGGTQVRLVRLPIRAAATPLPPAPKNRMRRRRPRARGAFAGREDA